MPSSGFLKSIHISCSLLMFYEGRFSKTPFFHAVSACPLEFDVNKYAEILKKNIKISGSHSHKSWYVFLWAAGLKHIRSATLMATVLLILMCWCLLNNLPILDCEFIGSVCTEHICGHLRRHEWGMMIDTASLLCKSYGVVHQQQWAGAAPTALPLYYMFCGYI